MNNGNFRISPLKYSSKKNYEIISRMNTGIFYQNLKYLKIHNTIDFCNFCHMLHMICRVNFETSLRMSLMLFTKNGDSKLKIKNQKFSQKSSSKYVYKMHELNLQYNQKQARIAMKINQSLFEGE